MIIVDLPRYPVAATIKWVLRQPSQVNRSEFGGGRRVNILAQASYWTAEVTYPPIMGEDAVRPWRAAFARLQGRANAFRLSPCEQLQRLSVGGNTGPALDGAGQVGTTIATKGWYPGSALLVGNFVTIADRLHQVVSQSIADADSRMSIEIMPHIANGLADGTRIEAARPYALMSMVDDEAGWTVNPGQRYELSFSCEEAF